VPPHPQKLAEIVSSLLDWYSKNARDLPWRGTADPYAIYVSEIMLQQTQVRTVLPYWKRWMGALPGICDLSRAKPEKLHKLWEGLGYYTRVRNMQKAAQQILAKHGGAFPDHYEDVLDLPGVGPYTAGAICSIAFNQPTPILDGNVIRVLARLFGVAGDPKSKTVSAKLWKLSGELVRCAANVSASRRPNACSHLNQALMELGALVCAPKVPVCAECPVARVCLARREGKVHRLPGLPKRVRPIPRRFAAFVVWHRGRLLVRQRPDGVVNARLWELPNTEVETSVEPVTAARESLGFAPPQIERLFALKHSITKYRITMDVYRVSGLSERPEQGRGQWLSKAQLSQLTFPSAHGEALRRTLEELVHER
jgi:A/G-specific adenine glycosylase